MSIETKVRSAAEMLIDKLRLGNQLSDDDEAAIERLPIHQKHFQARQIIAGYGDRPHDCCVIVEGFAARSLMISEGAKQICSLHLPGDIPDIMSLHTSVLDHDLHTITACTVGLIPHAALKSLCADRPNVGAAFWRESLLDAAIYRQWIANLGRRDALTRTAHLLSELRFRLEAIGRASAERFALPLSQIDLADCLGTSVVHMNRVLMDMRRQGLINYDKASFHLLDRTRLEEMSDFDPLYLKSPGR